MLDRAGNLKIILKDKIRTDLHFSLDLFKLSKSGRLIKVFFDEFIDLRHYFIHLSLIQSKKSLYNLENHAGKVNLWLNDFVQINKHI